MIANLHFLASPRLPEHGGTCTANHQPVAFRCARQQVQPWRISRRHQRRHSVAVGAQALAAEHLLPVLADAASTLATAVADAITLTTAEGNAIVSISPQAGATAAAAPPDVWQVATLSTLKGGAAATAAWLLLKMLHQEVVATPVDGMPQPEEGPPPHHLQDIPRLLFAAGVKALRKPARLLLPPTAVLFIARCAGEVATAALKVQDGALALAADPSAAVLARIDQLTGAGASSAASILAFWVLVAFKDEVLGLVLSAPEVPDDTAIVTGPLSAVASAALVAAGVLSVLNSFGVNLEPVMAVGGVSTIFLGFGSQIVTTNFVSGIDLFFSSTFNKGERVSLLTAGGDTIVSGVVEAINLLNTTVRTDLGVPVSIPNKAVAEMLVKNESRIKFSTAMTTFRCPRQVLLTFKLRLQDMGRVEEVKAGIMAFLEASDDVEPSLPSASWFGGPTDYYLEVGMLAHCVREQAANYGDFRQRMLWGAEAAIRSAGAQLAVPTALYYQDKPPPPPPPPLQPAAKQAA